MYAWSSSVLSQKFVTPLRPDKALSVGGGAKAWWRHVERRQHPDSALSGRPQRGNELLGQGTRDAAPRWLPAGLTVGVLLAAVAGAQAASAVGETVVPQAQVPVFDQPRFNRPDYQPAVARAPDGRSVVVWTDADDAGKGVYAQRYAADGRALGAPIEVNNPADAGDQERPDVAMDAAGNFVVVWHGPAVILVNASVRPLFYQRFGADGGRLGTPVAVNGTTTTDCPTAVTDGAFASVVLLADDTVGIGYQDDVTPALRARAFDANDVCIAEDEELPQSGDVLSDPQLVASPDGGVVLGGWLRSNSAGTEVIVETVTFNPGAPDAAVQVSDGAGDVNDFDLALGPAGPVVVWDGTDAAARSQRTVRARVLNNDASPATAAVTVYTGGTAPAGPLPAPRVSVDADGDFAVAWVALGAENLDIMARLLDPAAAPLTPVLQVNDPGADAASTAVDGQNAPDIAMDADGDPVVVWQAGNNSDGFLIQRLEVAQLAGSEEVDLGAVLADGGASVPAGAPLAYEVSVVNNHPGATPTGTPAVDSQVGVATGIRLSLSLDQGVGFEGTSNGDWDCGVTSPTAGQVDCILTSPLPPGGTSSTVLTVDLLAPSPGSVTGSAAVDGQQFDPVVANNTAGVTTTVSAADLVPDAFAFTDLEGVDPGVALTSAPVTITGISAPAPMSVRGPPSVAYSVDGGPFTSAPATVAEGASVRVRVTASSIPGAVTNATLGVGGVEDTFTVTTRADAPPPEEGEATERNLGGRADSTPSSGGTGSAGWPLLLVLLGAVGLAASARGSVGRRDARPSSLSDLARRFHEFAPISLVSWPHKESFLSRPYSPIRRSFEKSLVKPISYAISAQIHEIFGLGARREPSGRARPVFRSFEENSRSSDEKDRENGPLSHRRSRSSLSPTGC